MSKYPKANKELGQHFLVSEKVINKICDDFAQDCDLIVEVGPGPGVLTKHLAQHNKDFFVLEKDERFPEILESFVKKENIFLGDALEFDWNDFITTNNIANKNIWLVSNLPYNVGTVLFTQFIEVKEIEYMTLMFQKEVGDKTYHRDEKNQMNGLLFLTQCFFESKQLIKVSPGCFNPPPKVDSVVVSYKRLDSPHFPLERFNELNKFSRNVFSMKRKQIRKVLKSTYPQKNIEECLDKVGIEYTTRSESLSFDQLKDLFNTLY